MSEWYGFLIGEDRHSAAGAFALPRRQARQSHSFRRLKMNPGIDRMMSMIHRQNHGV